MDNRRETLGFQASGSASFDFRTAAWRGVAIWVIVAVCLVALQQLGFAIWVAVILLELTQVDPRFFIGLYIFTGLFFMLVWLASHNWLVRRRHAAMTHTGSDHDTHGPGSVDLARIRHTGLSVLTGLLLLGAFAVVFLVVYVPPDEHLIHATGHIIRDGMDTRSGYYTLWLVLLFSVATQGLAALFNVAQAIGVYEAHFFHTGTAPKSE